MAFNACKKQIPQPSLTASDALNKTSSWEGYQNLYNIIEQSGKSKQNWRFHRIWFKTDKDGNIFIGNHDTPGTVFNPDGNDKYRIIDETDKRYEFSSKDRISSMQATGLNGKITIYDKRGFLLFENNIREGTVLFSNHVKYYITFSFCTDTEGSIFIHNSQQHYGGLNEEWGSYVVVDEFGHKFEYNNTMRPLGRITKTKLKGQIEVFKDGNKIFDNISSENLFYVPLAYTPEILERIITYTDLASQEASATSNYLNSLIYNPLTDHKQNVRDKITSHIDTYKVIYDTIRRLQEVKSSQIDELETIVNVKDYLNNKYSYRDHHGDQILSEKEKHVVIAHLDKLIHYTKEIRACLKTKRKYKAGYQN